MDANRKEPKQGRPRKYRLKPDVAADNTVVGWALTAAKELDERLFDIVCDLPDQALSFTAPGTGISIGSLFAHIYWTDTVWYKRITGRRVPQSVEAFFDQATAQALHEGRAFDFGGRENLFAMADQVRKEYSYPAIQSITEPHKDLSDQGIPMTMGGVLTHVLWGKTYHTGQIGIMRMQWGSDYIWKFEEVE